MKILLVEDELIIAEDMKVMLEKLNYHVIGIAVNYDEAIQLIKSNIPDLVLVDITIEGTKDGIDLVAHINEYFDIPVIFATSNTDVSTVEKAKKVISHGYLLKPFSQDDLYTSIELAIANYKKTTRANQKPKDSIFIKDNDLFVRVNIDEILWLKSDGNYTDVQAENKCYVVRGTVKEILDELDERFIRVHKSYVVQLKKIEAVGSAHLIIKGHEIPIGKMHKESILSNLKLLR